jgi:4-alpha-glucanotransferase
VRSSPSGRLDAFERFCVERRRLEDYARFRAAGERWGVDWRRWPMPSRDGRLSDAEVDTEAAAYHRYVQWIAEEQLATLSRSGPGGLYLDLPVGVHPDGYDVWRERATFAPGVSAGAPPDDLFAGGQDWGFPPLHPDRIREQGYRYPVECLRHAMRHAAAVRVDHVMGLHRMYWVPQGFPADAGVYVRYRPDEWYAILAIESHRAGATVVGEDLGTVPAVVRTSMRRRGLLRSHVLEMEVDPDRSPPIRPPGGSLASMNTHDLPPFAEFWSGLDVDRRVELGLASDAEAASARRRRERVRDALMAHLRAAGFLGPDASGAGAVLSACLRYLADSPAEAVLVGLEDLWGETRAQNQPGVTDPGNWRRRAAYPLDIAWELPDVAERLRPVAALRREAAARPSEAAQAAEAAEARA